MLSLVVLLNLVFRLLNHVKTFLWLLTHVNNFFSRQLITQNESNLSSKLIFHKRMLIVQWPPCPSFLPLMTTRVSRGTPIIAIQIIESKPRNWFQPGHEAGRVIILWSNWLHSLENRWSWFCFDPSGVQYLTLPEISSFFFRLIRYSDFDFNPVISSFLSFLWVHHDFFSILNAFFVVLVPLTQGNSILYM